MTTTFTTPTDAGVEVGNLFVCSWGYDQTNIDFYKVVALTPKGVKVQAWTAARLAEYSGHEPQVGLVAGEGPVMVADDSEFDALGLDYFDPDYNWKRAEMRKMVPSPILTKRLQAYCDTVSFKAYSFANAYKSKADEVEYATGLGWGH